MSTLPALFQPIRVGDLDLSHRVVLAPLTRFRADDKHVPLPDLVAEYYAQRASIAGTLLITEATFIAPKAGGYPYVPGIWSEDQIKAWKKVTDAVHAKGSYIYLQLWALGRTASPKTLQDELGTSPDAPSPYVSASAIPLSTRPATDPLPRPLTESEITEYTELYAQAAENAVKLAGFDGVEIHGANGYLIDQFLQDVTNQRTDKYGGSEENRARFALEVIDAVVKRIGATKTALRLSPWNPYSDMGMKDPVPTFSYLISQIVEKHPDLAYIHAVEKRLINADQAQAIASTAEYKSEGAENDFIRKIWSSDGKRRFITAGGYTLETGLKTAEQKGDLVAFGRHYISNPDLPFRLKNALEIQKGDRSTYYSQGKTDPKGYTDYPFSAEFLKENPQAITVSNGGQS
ncbi:Chanoclavine-I aldehyde reductase fgaOx3 [Psilocybe cubensis]|uniref:Chanoclavine-I aldehyde reductase fgaOx3 n=2 Tax=Psilocybe cubensis TaxID=181762 RepID=A0ACB8GMN2_PSICU|nr:Chanoclavine-I aldehyde reductase fgaOx3 [Psilocybe cubensis]KAH9476285.1 Chanoclavine-I aldehyde reductase fgaOx3 [Psilocybe cubensis]